MTPTRKYTPEMEARIAAYAEVNGRNAAATHFEMTAGQVGGICFRVKSARGRALPVNVRSNENQIPIPDADLPPSWSEGPDWGEAASDTETIKSPEQLIAAAGIDMKLWRIRDHQVKTYQGYRSDQYKDLTFEDGKITGRVSDGGNIRLVTMWSVRVWFERREEAPVEDAIRGLLKTVREAAPRVSLPSPRPRGDHMLLPSFTDIHFGRLSLTGAYTPERTRQEMVAAAAEMITRVKAMGLRFDRVLFPFGNDATNVDNLSNTTTRGTWQEMSGNVRDALQAACAAHIEVMGMFADEIAPVDAVDIEGNHDRLLAFALGLVLKAHFHNDKRVTVDVSKSPRKYRRYGTNLIGMEHGDKVKPNQLALIMAQEAPALWAQTKYRIFLRGHFHVEREVVHNVTGTGAVQIVTFPAFCPPDEWEKQMGYLGAHRAAEARIFHLEHGPAGNFPVFVDELLKPEPAKRGGRAIRLSPVAASARKE